MNINNTGQIEEKLIIKAKQAAISSYSPYSGIKIGAAILTDENNIFAGCNIENSSYGLTICAERVAFANAIAGGSKQITAIAVHSDEIFPIPCGACVQFMAEFSPDLIIVVNGPQTQKKFLLSDIFPYPFKL